MSPVRGRVVALACALAAVIAPSAADARRSFEMSAEPDLFPAFSTGTHDYVVRCDPDTPVRLSLAARDGAKVAVGDQSRRSGSFDRKLHLKPGRAVSLVASSGGRERAYNVRCLPPDFPDFDVERRAAPQAHYYVVTPGLKTRAPGYAAVFDDRGAPVWWMRDDPAPFNATLMPTGGIAWTQLTGPPRYQSLGHYDGYALDGSPIRQFSAEGILTDLHELRVAADGHAWVIAYAPRYHLDFRRWGGPRDAGVLDGEIQELDERGKRVWTWSTRGHVGLGETSPWLHRLLFEQPAITFPGGRVYDTVHMNSVEPFGSRLVFSLRHTDAVYEIDRRTGRVAWKLGGVRTKRSLEIVGDPVSPSFDGQHDARFAGDRNSLTVYDNGILHKRPPRAVEYRIDRKKRTATFVNAVSFPEADRSTCCGSARRLPRGNWVVSWGNTPWVTEQTEEGDPVLTLGFPGRTSYRAEPVTGGQLTRRALRAGMDAMAP
ncbi:MAG TPA: arylsulfotransferase family protein [Thermoleophilaceae bacterium]|nr:arylsulfotransferase family protein [Thermoleophilaceae bacterium]